MKNTQSWIKFLKLNLENRIFLMLKCQNASSTSFYLANFLFSLSIHTSRSFPVMRTRCEPLAINCAPSLSFFQLFILLWLIRGGSTLHNLLKIKEFACFFEYWKISTGGLQRPLPPQTPSWKTNVWKFLTSSHYHWKLSAIIKKRSDLQVLWIYTAIDCIGVSPTSLKTQPLLSCQAQHPLNLQTV